jgi:flagellar biosynthetic protein FliO
MKILFKVKAIVIMVMMAISLPLLAAATNSHEVNEVNKANKPATLTEENIGVKNTSIIDEIDKKAKNMEQGHVTSNTRVPANVNANAKKSDDENQKLSDFYNKPIVKEETHKIPAKVSISGAFAKMLIYLGLTILVIFMLAWLFKKISASSTSLRTGGKLVKVLTREYIGPKNYMAIVEVSGRFLLLGVTAENISILTELDNVKNVNLVSDNTSNGNSSILSKFISKKLKNKKTPQGFEKALKSTLKEMSTVEETLNEKKTREIFSKLKDMATSVLNERAEQKSNKNNNDAEVGDIADMIKSKVRGLPQL